MLGGLLSSTSRFAVVAIVGIVAGSLTANAADLGGNCCADLEERVAELEATTARKGNRKVSLQIYGSISQQIMFWDDGAERNAYVLNNQTATQLLGFQGSARINPDWSAGYKLEFETNYNPNGGANQRMNGEHGGSATGAPLSLRHSYLYLKHEQFGTVFLGHGGVATSLITDINLATDVGTNVARTITFTNGPAFLMRRSGTTGDSSLALSALTNRVAYGNQTQLLGLGGLTRRAGVRWQSPNFLGLTKSSGFNFQAGWWGEDDMWDTALRYVEDFGSVRFAAGIGYAWSGDNDINCANLSQGVSAPQVQQSAVNCTYWGGSASIMHVPTGLYLTGAYGELNDKNRDVLFGRNVDNKDSGWYVQAGIQQKWFSLGNTTVYGEYLEASGGASVAAGARNSVANTDALNSLNSTADIIGTSGKQWGFGITQAIDAAAMVIYIAYKHGEMDLTLQQRSNLTNIAKSNPIDDWQAVVMGATIKF